VDWALVVIVVYKTNNSRHRGEKYLTGNSSSRCEGWRFDPLTETTIEL